MSKKDVSAEAIKELQKELKTCKDETRKRAIKRALRGYGLEVE